MRILYVVKHFPCLSQTFILNEVRALTQRGCHVQVVSALDLREPIELDPLIASRVSYLRHGSLYRYGAPADGAADAARAVQLPGALESEADGVSSAERRAVWTLLGAQDADSVQRLRYFFDAIDVIALVRRHRIAHLHADFAEENVGLVHLVSQVTGLPFTFKMRAYDIFAEPRPELPIWAAAAARVFTISEYNRDWICRRWNLAPERVTVSYDGVDTASLVPVTSYVHRPFRIVSTSRLVEKKGFPVLLEACRQLRTRVPFHCDIYGDGPLRAALAAQVEALGLGSFVTLHGSRPHAEVLAALETASVFALACVEAASGDRDGTPNALLEAMARGIPVVSTRLSGIPEIVRDGIDGLLAEPGDATGFADALARLAGDRHLAESMRAEGETSARTRFTIDRTVDGFLRATESPVRAAPADGGDAAAWAVS